MSLIVAGIDEAGYGPMLGPLCVAMTAFRVEGWKPEDGPPDLWKRLKGGVCRKPTDKRRRVAVDDSKKLKLPNDGGSNGRHPLMHLERGVLAFMGAAEGETPWPGDDLALFRALNSSLPPMPWYAGQAAELPLSLTAAEIKIAANLVRAAMAREGAGLAAIRCSVLGEGEFNEIVRAQGTKGATTGRALIGHLGWAWQHLAVEAACSMPGGIRVVCDRQGGRTQYGALIAAAVPEATIEVLEESARSSRYLVRGGPREMTVLFMPEADKAHLPVALASMTAKLCRELCMARFNRYWSARLPELKPTAGYYGDARRWLEDAATVLTPQERASLVRLA